MILVNRAGHFVVPDCASSKLVGIAPFREQEIANGESKSLLLLLRCFNRLYRCQIKPLVLNIGDGEIGSFCGLLFRL